MTLALLFVLLLVMVFVLMINRGRSTRMLTEAGPLDAAGPAMACHHCQHTGFEQKSVQLNTAGMTLLGLDWANRQATCLICTRCGFIHWFHPQ